MRLQLDRRGVVLLIGGLPDKQSLSFQLVVILNQDSIKEDSDVGRRLHGLIGVE